MNCCVECFDDQILKNFINDINQIGDCDYCVGRKVNTVKVRDLNPFFSKLMGLYVPTECYEHYDPEIDHPAEVGCLLITLFNEDWSIFANKIQDYEIDLKLLFDILDENKLGKKYIRDRLYSKISEGQSYKDPLFEWKIYWNELKEELKHQNRFFPFFDINNKMIEVLKYKEVELPIGKKLYRARQGEWSKSDMLAPPKERVQAGRANPKGISYLYCAIGEDTSVAEIRPWKGAKVTVAEMLLIKNLKVIDLTSNQTSPFAFKDLDDLLKCETIVNHFSAQLSTPIDPMNSEIDYLPTQYITELIKVRDYDGMIYKSVMGPENNIVLFDQDSVKVSKVMEYQIKDILYKYKVEEFEFVTPTLGI